MENIDQETLGLKAYRLSEMNDHDWSRAKRKYGDFDKTNHIIPTFILLFLFLGAAIAFGLKFTIPKVMALIIVIISYSAYMLGCRKGEKEGFISGYEVGKIDGVCRCLDISESKQEEVLRKARDLIIEFKIHSGDPTMEIGDNFKKDS